MPRQLRSTGRQLQVDNAFQRPLPEYDPRSGNHLWMVSTVFRVNPEHWTEESTEIPLLDPENLITAIGPGCLFCERPYSKLLATRRCTGEPRE